MLLEDLRREVLETARRMVRDECAHGAQGNISARGPEGGLIAITPSAIHYNQMSVEDIAVIDENGEVVQGPWKPTSETPMHTVLYRERPDIGAAVHSHAPYSTVFAIIDDPIPAVLVETATCLGGQVPVASYRQPGTEELGRMALRVMGSGVAVLLANHGLLTVGQNLTQAYEATLAAETTARLVIMARSMNVEPNPLPPETVDAMRESYLRHYGREKTI